MNKKNSHVDVSLTRRALFSAFGALGLTGATLSHLDNSPALASAALNTKIQDNQGGWRWCNKCQGLFFSGNSQGVCPAWGAHDSTGSGNYQLVDNVVGGPGQHNWRWCNKCQGLFFDGYPFQGRCPAGDSHIITGSGNYVLMSFTPGSPGQHNWRWCNKCMGLFFAGSFNMGACPAWDAHDLSRSGDYVLVVS